MWFEEVDEIFKGYLPYYVLVFLPIFIIVSPGNPVMASHEFPVYRMQHFDLHSVSHGCRGANINLEARSLTGWSTSRHCVITRLQDLTIDHFRNIRAKAGALLIVLPDNMAKITSEDTEHLLALENAMLAQEITIPVYFSPWNQDLSGILHEVDSNYASDDRSKSALDAMMSSVAANLYQVVVNAKTPVVKSDMKIATIQGNLVGKSQEGKLPTIAIVAHYDSFGVAPELSFGADSNGSGVAMLLELVRIFSTLYADAKTHGKYNIVFLLTGGGKINYQGSKKWLEDQLDSLDGSIIQDASYVLCLDTLATSTSLYMHVSKPPKDNSPASHFHRALKSSSSHYHQLSDDNQTNLVEGVHKKINLADDILAWEHERYSIRRLSAFTLSSLRSHKTVERGTILDRYGGEGMLDTLVGNTRVVAEALAAQIYNTSLEGAEVFGKSLSVEQTSIDAWLKYLSEQPRSAQILSNKDNALVGTLKDTFSKYLRDVKVTYAVPDKRDPDFQFYDVTKGIMNIYNVKPAVFDLILTLAIVLYLVTVYFAIQKFPLVYTAACSLITNHKKVN